MASNAGLIFIEDCASGKYEEPYELFSSMITTFKIPAEDSFNYISRLSSSLSKITNLPKEHEETVESLLACFNHLKAAMHAYKVRTPKDFRNFCETIKTVCDEITEGLSSSNPPMWIESLWDTNTLEKTLAAIKYMERFFREDISAVRDVFITSTEPAYLLPYISIIDTGLTIVPGKYNDMKTNIIPSATKSSWSFSAVTSNTNEDILAGKSIKKTTMNSRKRLYNVFTTVPEDNLSRLKEIIPTLGTTCIPSLTYKVVSVNKSK